MMFSLWDDNMKGCRTRNYNVQGWERNRGEASCQTKLLRRSKAQPQECGGLTGEKMMVAEMIAFRKAEMMMAW